MASCTGGQADKYIGDQNFVSLTTFKSNGDPVPTPVWIAPVSGGRVGFTTGSDTWKVKRVRRDPRVEMIPSDRQGRALGPSKPVIGTAELVTSGTDFDEVRAAIKAKYRWRVTLIHSIQWAVRTVKRTKTMGDDTVVVITLVQ